MGELERRSTTPAKAAKKAAAKKAVAKKAPAKKAAAKKVTGAKAAPGKATAKKTAKKIPAKKAAAKKAAAKRAPAKKVPPRKADTHRPHKKAKKVRTAEATTPSDGHSTATSGPSMGVPQLPAPPVDPMSVLGLSGPLRVTDLRRAWRVFAARHHPDRGGDAVTFARGQHAYDVLKYRLDNQD